MSQNKDELMRKRERIFLEELGKLLSNPEAQEKIGSFKRRWRIADDAVWPPLSEPIDQEKRRTWAENGLYRDRQTFLKHPPRHVNKLLPRMTYGEELMQLAQDLDLLPDHGKLVEFVVWNVVAVDDLAKLGWKDFFRLASNRSEEPIAIPGFKPVGLSGWLAVPIVDLLRDHIAIIRRSRHSSERDYEAVRAIITRLLNVFRSELKPARDRRGGTKKGRTTGMRDKTKEKYRRICEQYHKIRREDPDLTMKEIAKKIGEPRSTIYRALSAGFSGELAE